MSKVAAIVGVGPGLGASLAKRFARGGFKVALMSRSGDKLIPFKDEIEKECGSGTAITVSCDVGNVDEIKQAFSTVEEKLGTVTALVYNAGNSFAKSSALDINVDELMTGFRVGAVGAVVASQLVIPGMLKEGGGTILLSGATAGLRGGNGFAAFAMPKFALRAFSQSLAREFGPQGIHVTHVNIDGLIGTPRVYEMMPDRPKENCMDCDELADQYWMVHSQPRSVWTQELDIRPHTEKW